jgi:hypothetical protein
MGLVISKGLTLRKEFQVQPYMWEFPQQYGLWSPAEISTALWLDAADASTVTTVSGNVSQWNDKSGNGRNASQATSANRPVYVASSVNGLPCVEFQATNQILSTSYTLPTSNIYHFDVVKRLATLGAGGSIFGYQVSANRQFAGFRDNSNLWFGSGDSSESTVAANSSANTAHIFAYQLVGSTTAGLRFNGSIARSVQEFTGTCGGGTMVVGEGGGTGPLGSIIGVSERITVNASISLSDIQKVEGYLAHKWGLTASLPSDHPYKTVGPTP